MRLSSWLSLFIWPILLHAASDFSPYSGLHPFVAESELHLTWEHADLVAEIDLKSYEKAIRHTCELSSALFANISIHDSFRPQLDMICAHDNSTFFSLMDFVNGEGVARRFAFAATLFASVISGIGGYIFGSSHGPSQTDEMLMRNQKHIVQTLHNTENLAHLNHEFLHNLSIIIKNDEEQALFNQKKTDSTFLVLISLLRLAQDINQLENCIQNLVLHRRLVPGIIAPQVLQDKLVHLQSQATAQKKRLSITGEADLFQCPVSFGLLTNYTLRIGLHIPLVDFGNVFHLHRFVPAPVTMNDSHYMIAVDTHHIAWNDQNQYILPTELEISRCTEYRQFISCSMFSGLFHRNHETCLNGIRLSDEEMVMKTCTIKSMPSAPQFWRLIRNQYLVHHPRKELMSISCNGTHREGLVFEGTQKVNIPLGCTAKNSHFELFAAKTAFHENFLVEAEPLELSFGKTTFGPRITDGLIKKFDSSVVHDPSWPYENPEPEDPDYACHIGTGIAIGAGLVVTCLCVYLFRRRQASRKLSPPASTGNDTSPPV